MIRDGYTARWHGTDYDAVPGVDGEVRLYAATPADGFTEVRPGRYVRIVPDHEVESLRYVRTHSFLPFVIYRVVLGVALLVVAISGLR